MTTNRYPLNSEQIRKLAVHPQISGTFALDKNLWQGRPVAVVCIESRGNAHRETKKVVLYGTLDLTAGTADQLGLTHFDGEVTLLHKNRALRVHDMTRTTPKVGA